MTPELLSDPPTVTVVMAVYNGAKFLPAQLDSLTEQCHSNWRLVVADDGSDDGSGDLLDEFATRIHDTGADGPHKVEVLQGPGQGATANFMFLLRHLAQTAPDTDWIAFADQDDVWLPDKLGIAHRLLGDIGPEIPALYCSRTWITSEDLSQRRLSAARPRTAGFRNALVQNIASGNTILLNPAATRLVLRMVRITQQVVVHDWWIYQLITGAGGQVIHDDAAYILYRQHGANQIGANDRWRARIQRLTQLMRGEFRDWNRTNVAALTHAKAELTPENRAILLAFSKLPHLALPQRLAGLFQLGLYRQTAMSTLALLVATVFGRL